MNPWQKWLDGDPVWKYEDYSDWSRMLAKSNTVERLERELHEVEYKLSKATMAHLRAIHATGSMNGCSQRRAQSRNNVSGLAERKAALKDALELHLYYPDRCV